MKRILIFGLLFAQLSCQAMEASTLTCCSKRIQRWHAILKMLELKSEFVQNKQHLKKCTNQPPIRAKL